MNGFRKLREVEPSGYDCKLAADANTSSALVRRRSRGASLADACMEDLARALNAFRRILDRAIRSKSSGMWPDTIQSRCWITFRYCDSHASLAVYPYPIARPPSQYQDVLLTAQTTAFPWFVDHRSQRVLGYRRDHSGRTASQAQKRARWQLSWNGRAREWVHQMPKRCQQCSGHRLVYVTYLCDFERREGNRPTQSPPAKVHWHDTRDAEKLKQRGS